MAPMFGWLSEARTSASRWNRLARSLSSENSSGRILIATSRLSLVSRARYTSPIPPLPRRAVISNEPSRVPTSTDIGLSVETQNYFPGHYAEKRQRKQFMSPSNNWPERFSWSHDTRAIPGSESHVSRLENKGEQRISE